MQAETFQDSDFAEDFEDSIYFGRNIVRFWKSYICSNKLDVQEANFSFTQFNRIRNHLYGHRIEIRRYSRSRFMGFYGFSPWSALNSEA